ncbi:MULTISPECIES: hypothetical protein [unclassified Streptomyces]|uniref:hypothetical protein n=1 Tax=unclassified Streptomyces TaxID=2593676 RepID=UPI0011AA5916|nr:MULTISPECIES: hypothetical protein [Streptomyces]QHC32153.1 hypothetical protein GR129_28495 [Streptomyces sp. HF10]WKE68847.1 hypothetical protein QHG49_07340 [Streptomyces sp. WP-1]
MKNHRLAAVVAAAGLVGASAVAVGGLSTASAQATAAAAPVSRARTVVGPASEPGEPSVAHCPEGMRVLNGGYNTAAFSQSNGGEPYDGVQADAPLSDGKGWFAGLMTGRVQARAVCVPQDEAPRVVVGPTSGEHADSDAHCPEGTDAVGGGYYAQSWYKNGWGESQDAVTASAPLAGGKGWYARQFAGKVQARALCI